MFVGGVALNHHGVGSLQVRDDDIVRVQALEVSRFSFYRLCKQSVDIKFVSGYFYSLALSQFNPVEYVSSNGTGGMSHIIKRQSLPFGKS